MQFEELQQQWRRLEQKLDQSLALETELVRRLVMQPARRRVHWLAFWSAIDLVFCVGVLLFGAVFLSGHWHEWQTALPAGVVMISALALLMDSIWQLERVAALEWCGPVAEIQASLERLRVARIRQFKWIMLLSPLVGFCGLLVGLHWLLEWLSVDRFHMLNRLNTPWILANYAFGVLCVPLGHLAARTLAQRCHRHRWWQSVLDGISGKTLTSAALDVDRWASLQSDPSRNVDGQ